MEKADDKNATNSFRGPLKYSVETSAPQLEAGKNTTVFLLITNPYDIAVEIVGVQPLVPAQFRDSAKVPFWKRIWQEIWQQAESEAKEHLADAQAVLSITSSNTDAEGTNKQSVILQPGNTTIYEFRVRTKQAILFSPAIHNLNAQVQYKMASEDNFDTVKYQLNIRAPLKALIYGSVIGAIVGTMLQSIKQGLKFSPFAIEGYIPFITSILVGVVLVIAFARKKDAQPFITVEDFFGGFFIGFLAGYVGDSMLNPFVPK